MSKGTIKVGDMVKLDGSEVFKVFSVDNFQAILINAENKYIGSYPFNELTKVSKVKVIYIWRELK